MGDRTWYRGAAAVLAAVLLLVACGGTSGEPHPTAVESDDTDSSEFGTPANNNPAQQQEQAVELIVSQAETCHTEKLAGGNSDALLEFVLAFPDGTPVTITFTSSKQPSEIAAAGVVKDNKVLVRVPVIAIGEELSVDFADAKGVNVDLNKLPKPVLTVPDTSGSNCDLSEAETKANGSVNQPNTANAN